MTAEELLREMSAKLQLDFESQDWGIVNADPDRLREFIDFYEAEPLAPTQRFELGELIIASANERLLAGATEADAHFQVFVDFVRIHWQEQKAHLTYWQSLQSNEEFPIVAVLKRINIEFS